MPARTYKVTGARTIDDLVRQLNTTLALISKDLALPTAFDGDRPTLSADLDMKGHNLVNVGTVVPKVPASFSFQRVGYPKVQPLTDTSGVADAATKAALDSISAHLADLVLALQKLGVLTISQTVNH